MHKKTRATGAGFVAPKGIKHKSIQHVASPRPRAVGFAP